MNTEKKVRYKCYLKGKKGVKPRTIETNLDYSEHVSFEILWNDLQQTYPDYYLDFFYVSELNDE